jgi:hypothetical protein
MHDQSGKLPTHRLAAERSAFRWSSRQQIPSDELFFLRVRALPKLAILERQLHWHSVIGK